MVISPMTKTLGLVEKDGDVEEFDENSLVLITESDLDGYEENPESGEKLACRVQFASQAAISRLSYLWLRCHTVGEKVPRKNSVRSIHVY